MGRKEQVLPPLGTSPLGVAPLAHDPTQQVMLETPQLKALTFSSFDWNTHPIDMYDGPQGWGPFNGPWTPWDWRDPAIDIADTFGHGESNDWQFAPDYDVITLFSDHSLDFAWNTSYDVEAQNAFDQDNLAYTSTIANVVPGNSAGLFQRLRQVITSAVSAGAPQ